MQAGYITMYSSVLSLKSFLELDWTTHIDIDKNEE